MMLDTINTVINTVMIGLAVLAFLIGVIMTLNEVR